jgi:DNA/RNA non-specific endonuclease
MQFSMLPASIFNGEAAVRAFLQQQNSHRQLGFVAPEPLLDWNSREPGELPPRRCPSRWLVQSATNGLHRPRLRPGTHCTRMPITLALEVDNSSTFLMTNMMPQVPELNRGVWGDLEEYCRELAQRRARNFISPAGPVGKNGSIGRKEKIAVPAKNWKVIVVRDRQGLGLQGVTPNAIALTP